MKKEILSTAEIAFDQRNGIPDPDGEPFWFVVICLLVPDASTIAGVQVAMMSRHFPIFIDIARMPPLVVGASASVEAKILLRKFAPVVDLVTDVVHSQGEYPLQGVRAIVGVTVAVSQFLFKGRPLIVIDTGDDAVNGRLVGATAIGVPVNVPDKPALCSFYFGSLVDRDPVTIAISTAGLAPVLGQRLRARLEDMLAPGYGRLAWYLWRLRDRLKHLPAAHRRATQHRIIDGPVADLVMDGEEQAADSRTLEMITGADHDADGIFHLIDTRAGDPQLLSLRGAQVIRNADIVLHERDEMPAILDLARREAVVEGVLLTSGVVSECVIRDMAGMASDGARVVVLVKGDATAAIVNSALASAGLTAKWCCPRDRRSSERGTQGQLEAGDSRTP